MASLVRQAALSEMLAGFETDNFLTRTINPWDLERTPGGSSGGDCGILIGRRTFSVTGKSCRATHGGGTLSAEGLPIGVQLMGRPYQDELLLELAVRLEEARSAWTAPPVSLL